MSRTPCPAGDGGACLVGAAPSPRSDVFKLFDRRDNDIEYFYTSRLPGEPLAGTDDRHIHPVEPRSLRLTVNARF